MTSEVDVVNAWHDALNAGEIDRLAGLVSDDVAVGGPRGSSRGANLLRAWVDRAGIELVPARTFHRGETVVVEQRAAWRSPATGELGEPTTVSSVFQVRADRIVSVLRYDDLTTALNAAGLTDSDEIEEGV